MSELKAFYEGQEVELFKVRVATPDDWSAYKELKEGGIEFLMNLVVKGTRREISVPLRDIDFIE